MSDKGNNVRLHRVLRASPEMVYKAFVTPDAYARWIPPRGYTAQIEEMDVRQGGRYRMSFTAFATGQAHHFGGEYLEVVANKRLVMTDRFDDPNLTGEMITSVELTPAGNRTEVHIVQEGIPDLIPLDDCYLGGQDSLMFLALMVEGHASH